MEDRLTAESQEFLHGLTYENNWYLRPIREFKLISSLEVRDTSSPVRMTERNKFARLIHEAENADLQFFVHSN